MSVPSRLILLHSENKTQKKWSK